jgi:ubiquinone/menaquinone biosynthesis C-methylase UbiE
MDYGKAMYRNYVKGRKLSTNSLDVWMSAIEEFLPDRPNPKVLDLGSGTGRFSLPLAERLGLTVVGVEPSPEMRNEALAHSRHERITYLEGSAEAVPCADEEFDVALLSMILHLVESLPKMCHEVVWVMKPEGIVMVRSAFADRLYAITFYEFFPAAREVDNARLPKLEEVIEVLDAAGLECVAHREVTQRTEDSLAAYCERMKLRAISSLKLISDEGFRAGIAAMEEAAKAEAGNPQPVLETVDLVVFKKKRGKRDVYEER